MACPRALACPRACTERAPPRRLGVSLPLRAAAAKKLMWMVLGQPQHSPSYFRMKEWGPNSEPAPPSSGAMPSAVGVKCAHESMLELEPDDFHLVKEIVPSSASSAASAGAGPYGGLGWWIC